MKKECKKVISILLLFVMVFSIFTFNDLDTVSASSRPMLTYNAHLQNIGWQGWVSEGSVSGTTGQSRQMEALSIKLSNNGRSMITYRAHVKDYGWLNWVQSGGIAGTTGKSCRLEGIQIKLNHEFVSRYDIYYRVHIANYGWLGWAKNGATAGSEGIGMPAEAIQIKIVNKGEKFSEGGKAAYTRPDLNYRAHCANVGWMNTVQDAQMAGTTGQARRMEALIINLSDFQGKSGISYRTHVSNIGWQSWKKSGQMMGTTGQSRQMEAVQIKLSPSLTPCFNIYYRVHVTNVGWLGWAKNGETAGSTGQALAIEAIEIKLVNKDSTIITGGSAVCSAPSNSNELQPNSSTTETIQITSSGQTVDTFNGVPAKYIPGIGNSNTGTYCCADYVSSYYKSVYGVTVSNMLPGRKPSATSGYFYVTSDPKSGDVGYQLNSSNRGHWFIIKSVNGDGTYTVIEQNWKWGSGNRTYCYRNRNVSYEATKGFKVYRWSGR